MFRSNMPSTRFIALVIVLAAAVARPAFAQTFAAPAVPANLKVPGGNTIFLIGQAIGTQNYVCLPTPTGGLEWKFQAPQATVFLTFRWINGEGRQQILTHFLSPNPTETDMPARATWQSSTDTSVVWAKKIAESNDPGYVAPGAIPWFLLQTAGLQRGPMGGSMLARTTFVQRINTTGGMMSGACSEVGSMQFVPYTAEYVFYEAAWAH